MIIQPIALPFAVEQFYNVFVQYNESVWPMQIVLYVIGLAILLLLVRARPANDRMISVLLALLWIWTAVIYCFVFFTRFTGSGWIIGAVLLGGGLWLIWVGGIQGRIRFAPAGGLRGSVGGLLIFYSLVAYPLVGLAVGHRYPAMPTFGLPCPVTIFTDRLQVGTKRQKRYTRPSPPRLPGPAWASGRHLTLRRMPRPNDV